MVRVPTFSQQICTSLKIAYVYVQKMIVLCLTSIKILCWELVSKRGGSWILHYVKSAYAVTDVPDQVPELISQRRRWLNGSFFAAIHSVVHFHYIYRSAHSFIRKFWIHVEMLYQVFNLIFSWFAMVPVLSHSLTEQFTHSHMTGKLLHCLCYPFGCVGRFKFSLEWHPYIQYYLGIHLPWAPDHVFPTVAWQ